MLEPPAMDCSRAGPSREKKLWEQPQRTLCHLGERTCPLARGSALRSAHESPGQADKMSLHAGMGQGAHRPRSRENPWLSHHGELLVLPRGSSRRWWEPGSLVDSPSPAKAESSFPELLGDAGCSPRAPRCSGSPAPQPPTRGAAAAPHTPARSRSPPATAGVPRAACPRPHRAQTSPAISPNVAPRAPRQPSPAGQCWGFSSRSPRRGCPPTSAHPAPPPRVRRSLQIRERDTGAPGVPRDARSSERGWAGPSAADQPPAPPGPVQPRTG